jgi:Sigma-70 region 2
VSVARTGDDERFAQVFDAHFRAVSAYALRRTTPAEAEDVVAETFLVAWRRLDELPEDPKAWLLGVARRILANQRRAAGGALSSTAWPVSACVPTRQDRRLPSCRHSLACRNRIAKRCSSSPGRGSRHPRERRRSDAPRPRSRFGSTGPGGASAPSFGDSSAVGLAH